MKYFTLLSQFWIVLGQDLSHALEEAQRLIARKIRRPPLVKFSDCVLKVLKYSKRRKYSKMVEGCPANRWRVLGKPDLTVSLSVLSI